MNPEAVGAPGAGAGVAVGGGVVDATGAPAAHALPPTTTATSIPVVIIVRLNRRPLPVFIMHPFTSVPLTRDSEPRASLRRRRQSVGVRAALAQPISETARAITRARSAKPANDSSDISSFARCVSGMVSVGLNAIEFDSEK